MFKKNKKDTSKGFTLIELLVVIAIIGILAGVILTTTGVARGKANRSAFLQEIKSAVNAFAVQCDSGNILFPVSENVSWTAGIEDNCGESGNTTFCVKAINKKIFSDVTIAEGCAVFVNQDGLYGDDACQIPFAVDSSCL